MRRGLRELGLKHGIVQKCPNCVYFGSLEEHAMLCQCKEPDSPSISSANMWCRHWEHKEGGE
jgi:hypothetical protein